MSQTSQSAPSRTPECHSYSCLASVNIADSPPSIHRKQRTIDQTRVCNWRTGILHITVQLTSSEMVPLHQEQISQVNIIVGSSWAINDDATKHTVPGLHGIVRVIPGRAILSRLEGICHGIPRRCWTLRDRRHAVVWISEILSNTMEMYCCSIDVQRVGNVNDNSVTPVARSVHEKKRKKRLDRKKEFVPICNNGRSR